MMRRILAALLICAAGSATAEGNKQDNKVADRDAASILLLRAAANGPAADLISYDALIGGEEIDSASDFGFFQASEDGYAYKGLRVRLKGGMTVIECEGGLAPSRTKGLFEGAYACGEELPVPISYQPKDNRLLPNLVDPNGVWEDEGFFVSKALSIKITPSKPISINPQGMTRLNAKDIPVDALTGMIGRMAPPHIQASGACGDGIAVFFPQPKLAGCVPADLFED